MAFLFFYLPGIYYNFLMIPCLCGGVFDFGTGAIGNDSVSIL